MIISLKEVLFAVFMDVAHEVGASSHFEINYD